MARTVGAELIAGPLDEQLDHEVGQCALRVVDVVHHVGERAGDVRLHPVRPRSDVRQPATRHGRLERRRGRNQHVVTQVPQRNQHRRELRKHRLTRVDSGQHFHHR